MNKFKKSLVNKINLIVVLSILVTMSIQTLCSIYFFNEFLETAIGNNKALDQISTSKLGIAMFIVGTVLVIIATIITRAYTKKTFSSLNTIITAMKKVGDGDLKSKVSVNSIDEIGILGNTLNSMTKDLENIVSNVNSSAYDIQSRISDLNTSINETVLSVEQVASSINEMAMTSTKQAGDVNNILEENVELDNSISNLSAKIEEIGVLTNSVGFTIKNGLVTVENLITTTDENNVIFESVTENINDMISSALNITGFLDLISQITEQTNLLALNASIEAARAGEAGRGFAVVADEIRKLADASKNATEEIREMVTLLNENSERVQSTIHNIKDVSTTQNKVVSKTREEFISTSELVEAISISSSEMQRVQQEMRTRKEKISENITSLAASVQENSACNEEISATTEEQLSIMENINNMSQELTNHADTLKKLISKFNV